jgi:hypothetical protein
VLRRLLAILILAGPLACGDPRPPNDEATCATESACVTLYREALARYQACMSEQVRAGYVGPGSPRPPTCDAMRADSERWAATVSRFRSRKQQEGAEEQGGGYEVLPLPPGPAK